MDECRGTWLPLPVRNHNMGYIEEPKGVNFVIEPIPLTLGIRYKYQRTNAG
jgi:hypothetical protein